MQINQKKAQALLRQGEVIAVPTETVFGMAADIHNNEALLKLYNLKGRPAEKPLVIQVAKTQEMIPYLTQVPFDLEKITEAFWPGPLTLVLPVDEQKVSGLIRAQLSTAAFRVTQNEATRALLEEYGPLAITSANRSGDESLLLASCIEKEFGDDFPILQSKESSQLGVPSTILAYLDSSWVVIRLGSLSLKELKKTLGYYPSVTALFNPKTLEYTLRPQLHLMGSPYDGSIKTVLGFSDKSYPDAEHIIDLGPLKKPQKIKKNICQCLKKIQSGNHPHVWVDLDFAKSGPLKKVAELLEHSARSGV